MLGKKAAGAGGGQVDNRELILSKGRGAKLDTLLHTIRSEDKNNYNTMNFAAAWSELFRANIHSINAQQSAEILFHLGRLEYYDNNLLLKILDMLKPRVTDFGYKEISQCLYGLGKLKFHDQRFTSLIVRQFQEDLGTIEASDIANLIFGVAKLEYYDQGFLDKFRAMAIENMPIFDAKATAKIIFGVAKIGYYDQALVEVLIVRFDQNLIHFDQPSLINSAYALTMILKNNHPDNHAPIEDLIVKLVQRVACEQVRKIEEKTQLLSVYYALDDGRRAECGELANKLEQRWNQEIKTASQSTVTISNTQEKIARHTHELARDMQQEFYIDQLGASVDIYLPLVNAVIQVDGPRHFHTSNPSEVTATTTFNSARIIELGYKLLRVRTDDKGYEATIKHFIDEQLTDVRSTRRTNTFQSSNKGKEVSDEVFEANFSGLSRAQLETSSALTAEVVVASLTSSSKKDSLHPKLETGSGSKKTKGKKKVNTTKQDLEISAEDNALLDAAIVENSAIAASHTSVKTSDAVTITRLNTQLIKAVTKATISLKEVEELLKRGASPDVSVCIDGTTITLLQYACVKAEINLVKLLLDAGANLEAATIDGSTALFAAAYVSTEAGTEIVKLLLDNRAHVNTARNSGETPLLNACCRNQKSAILLLQAGANPNAVNCDNLCALHLAVSKGYYDVVESLADLGADLNLVYEGATELAPFKAIASSEAIVSKHLRILKLLLNKGANPDITIQDKEGSPEITMLIYCAAQLDLDIAYSRCLVDAGADVNALTKANCSALGFSVKRDNKDSVGLLLASGADIGGNQQKIEKIDEYINSNFKSYKANPVKYIVDYDQPDENKIRALDRLLEQPVHSPLKDKIIEAKIRLGGQAIEPQPQLNWFAAQEADKGSGGCFIS